MRPDTVQWNCKQFLGDNKVLAMEFEALGMHAWLLNISAQEKPPGSIPNDMAVIRRWLRSPSDDVWRRVQPQIFTAWHLEGDRWFNSGMVETFVRKAKYAVRPQNQTGTTSVPNEVPKVSQIQETDTYKEKELDVGVELQEEDRREIDCNQAARKVFEECGLAGPEALMLVTDATRASVKLKGICPADAADSLIALWGRYERDIEGRFKCRVFKFFKAGMWQYPDKWQEMANGNSEPSKHSQNEQRINKNRAAIIAGLDLGGLIRPGKPTLQNRDDGGGNQDLALIVRGRTPGNG